MKIRALINQIETLAISNSHEPNYCDKMHEVTSLKILP